LEEWSGLDWDLGSVWIEFGVYWFGDLGSDSAWCSVGNGLGVDRIMEVGSWEVGRLGGWELGVGWMGYGLDSGGIGLDWSGFGLVWNAGFG
jgi:hypothetical protein